MYLLDPQGGGVAGPLARDKSVSALKTGARRRRRPRASSATSPRSWSRRPARSCAQSDLVDDLEIRRGRRRGRAERRSRPPLSGKPGPCRARRRPSAMRGGLREPDKVGSALSTASSCAPRAPPAAPRRSRSRIRQRQDRAQEDDPRQRARRPDPSSLVELRGLPLHEQRHGGYGLARARWVVKGRGDPRAVDREVTGVEPGKLLSWQGEPGAASSNNGPVLFRARGEGTRVDAYVCYAPPGGTVGRERWPLASAARPPSPQIRRGDARPRLLLEARKDGRAPGGRVSGPGPSLFNLPRSTERLRGIPPAFR